MPAARERVTVLSGNIVETNLGIDINNLEQLYNDVSVVIHAAGCSATEESIRAAVEMNVQGTSNMLQLTRNMKKLEARLCQ